MQLELHRLGARQLPTSHSPLAFGTLHAQGRRHPVETRASALRQLPTTRRQTSISRPIDLLTCINYRGSAAGYRLARQASETSIANYLRLPYTLVEMTFPPFHEFPLFPHENTS